MPEILEIEMYRRGALPVIGRTIGSVETPDAWYLKNTDAAEVASLSVGAVVEGFVRRGKLLVLETDRVRLGLRFGMTGRIVIDDDAVIEQLEYSSARRDPEWNRFVLHFVEGGSLAMNDPRRLGGVSLDPDLDELGPDAWSLTVDELAAALANRRIAIKALLLDQKRVAGLGNLLVDELCWRIGIAPQRPAKTVDDQAQRDLVEALGPMLDDLYELGGSNCGDLFDERGEGGRCPRDGAPLRHDTVGGRSTWWCPDHQV